MATRPVQECDHRLVWHGLVLTVIRSIFCGCCGKIVYDLGNHRINTGCSGSGSFRYANKVKQAEDRPHELRVMTYAPTTVAREMLSIARGEDRPLTPLELMKLTYISHGWSLCLRDVGLVSEKAQAWQYGPVYPSLYHALKGFRASPVREVPLSSAEPFGKDELSDDDKGLLKSVFQAYKGLNGVQLSALTHQPDTPWDKAWKRGKNTMIDDSEIKAHFCELRTRRNAS